MPKWIEGTVVNQKRWTQNLFTLQVEADVAAFEAGQFAKLALAVEGEMVARPYSFVNAPKERPHEFYYVTLPDGPLTQRLQKMQAGDAIYLAPRPAGFLVLSEIPDAENLWLISTGTGVGPFLSILKTEAPWQRFRNVVLVHAVRYSEELTYRDRARSPRDRSRPPGGRGGRRAQREDLSGYDLRQSGDGDGHERGANAARHEKAPASRAGSYHGGELLVKNAALGLLLVIGVPVLASCSATRLAYDNADTVLRFMASSYLDLDAAQSDDLTPRIVRFHQWHRSSELPAYAALLRSAGERAARGITTEDVAWGLANVRLRYRGFAAKAAEDAAPVLATLAPAQLAALERKLAEDNEKFAKKFLSPDDKERRRGQLKRMLERFRDFAGDLSPDQEARIERFALDHERHVVLRFEERQRWQRDCVAALKEQHEPQELGRRLAEMFTRPELRRSEEFIREDKRWDEDLGQLIVDLDRSLSPKQRAQVVRRLSDYAEDFAVLAGKRKEAA